MKEFFILLLPLLGLASPVPEFYKVGEQSKSFAALNIAAFNIQVFGVSKMDEPDVVQVLVDILGRYDMCLIQEIRDSSETAIYELLDEVNAAHGNQYDSVISERLGRTSSKEQYCFFYKRDIFTVETIDQWPDTPDRFEREPYSVVFNANGYDIDRFAFMAIHVKPDDAPQEIDHMVDVYDSQSASLGITDWIIGGDLNADCSYVTDSDWPNIRLRTDPRFMWVIDDDADTTLADSSCAYDRIILTGNVQNVYTSASVFDYWSFYGLSETLAKDTSDHYPVVLATD